MATMATEQFATKHGNDAINLGGWLVFSDGAMMERNPLGALVEPPDDPWERAKIQVRYREELLRRAIKDFQDMKIHLNSSVRASLQSGYGPPSQEELAKLVELQKLVKRRKQQLDAIQKLCGEHEPPEIAQRAAATAANRTNCERFISAIDEIRI